MKITFLLAVLLFIFPDRNYAHTWYVSSSTGDDGYNGSHDYPWKTLDKVNFAFPYLADGDSVLFKRGDTFDGNIRFLDPLSSTIILGAYGSGDKPVINGLRTITGWTETSSHIWQASFTGSNAIGMLTINGVVTPMGRYPNRGAANDGYRIYTTPTSSSVITDPSLGDSPSWVGAEVVIRKTHWIIDRAPVVSQSSGTITFTPPTSFAGIDGFGYFFQNDPKTLDVQGEWYYNPSTHTVQMYSTSDPDLFSVKAAVQDTLVHLDSRDNITFDNLTFSGSNMITFLANSCDHLTVQNCDIFYSGENGVRGDHNSYATFINDQVNYSGNNGLYVIGDHSTYWNNVIKNSGLWPGMGKSDNQAYMGMLAAGDNNIIEFNQVDSTGYNALYFNGSNVTVQNNFINEFCLTTDDGGGIYASGETTASGRVVKGNFVFNGKGNHNGTNSATDNSASGIYMDDLSAGVSIESNTIANCSENGIFVHNGHDIAVRDNTVYNAHQEILYHHDVLGTAIRSISQFNNIFFSRDTAQTTMALGNTYPGASDDFGSYGSYDSNYYVRPFKDTLNIQTNLDLTFTSFGLPAWTSAYGYDAHSHRSPITLPAYAPQTIGSGKFANTNFDNGLSNFFALGNYDTLLIENKIDGNTLKFGTSSSTTNTLGLYFDIGTITSGTKYLVKFSLQGRKSAGITLQLIKNGGAYNGISELRNLAYNSTTGQYEIIFNATATESALLVLQLKEQDAPVWIDNLDVREATMAAVNPDDYIKFYWNYTPSSSTVGLDGTYIDARSNVYSGSITLGAYSSAVLIKQPSIVQVYQIRLDSTVNASQTEFLVYPNPARGSFRVAISGVMPQKRPLVSIYTLGGALKSAFYMNSSVQTVNISGWQPGTYIVKIISNGKVRTRKMIML